MTEKQLSKLIQKYLSGEATKEEKKKVEQWYDAFDTFELGLDEKEDKTSFLRSWLKIKGRIEENEAVEEEILTGRRSNHKVLYRWIAVAAMLILISGTVYFIINQSKQQEEGIAMQAVKEDFKPGGNKAVLTLGNGQTIVLDSTNKGLLSMQGNTKILKLNKGLLSYKVESKKQKAKSQKIEVAFNTISTPRGGKYEVVLPDGSKVWLNAASSLKFPTTFSGKKRIVEMTGEAYFEIAQNEKQPFIVKKGKTEVKVLGTHFNVMAYEDEEAIKVSLLQGAVKVTTAATHHNRLLKPGEQIEVKQDGRMSLVKNPNLNKVMAWKNNLFWFENSNIQEIVKQLARWYDVDIEIEGNIPDRFTGSIPKDLTFSKVFEVLQKTGSVHYEIEEENKVIVNP